MSKTAALSLKLEKNVMRAFQLQAGTEVEETLGHAGLGKQRYIFTPEYKTVTRGENIGTTLYAIPKISLAEGDSKSNPHPYNAF